MTINLNSLVILYSLIETLKTSSKEEKKVLRLIMKSTKNRRNTKREFLFVISLFEKYKPFMESILDENENSLAQLVLMQDLTYNYYKTYIFIKENKSLETKYYKEYLEIVNEDINNLNQEYLNKEFIRKLLRKYFKFYNQLYTPYLENI